MTPYIQIYTNEKLYNFYRRYILDLTDTLNFKVMQ